MISFMLAVASVTLYVLSGALGAYAMARKVERAVAPSKVIFLIALLFHSFSIGIQSVSTSGTIMSGPNLLMLAAWALGVVMCVFMVAGKRAHAYVAFASPLIAALIIISQVLGMLAAGASPSNEAYYEWPTLALHIVFILFGTAAFAVSAAANIMQMYQKRLLKKKSERVFRVSMPAMSTLETVARRAAVVGLMFFIAGLLIGMGRFFALYAVMSAAGCEGSLMYLVPRMVLSTIVWVLFAAYLVLTYFFPHLASSKVRTALSIGAFVLSVVLLVVSAG